MSEVMPLGRMPGTEKFLESLVSSAADLAIFFVGVGEPDMMIRLYEVRTNLEIGLANPFGPDVAAAIAEAFVAAVISRRRELLQN
jgi:hypothetical protein